MSWFLTSVTAPSLRQSLLGGTSSTSAYMKGVLALHRGGEHRRAALNVWNGAGESSSAAQCSRGGWAAGGQARR